MPSLATFKSSLETEVCMHILKYTPPHYKCIVMFWHHKYSRTHSQENVILWNFFDFATLLPWCKCAFCCVWLETSSLRLKSPTKRRGEQNPCGITDKSNVTKELIPSALEGGGEKAFIAKNGPLQGVDVKIMKFLRGFKYQPFATSYHCVQSSIFTSSAVCYWVVQCSTICTILKADICMGEDLFCYFWEHNVVDGECS